MNNADQMLDKIDYKKIKHICVNLTNQCNLRCRYCFTHHNPKRMTLETLKRIIRFSLENFGIEKVTFFGGEPMLEFDSLIKPIVEWKRKEDLPITFSMTTNGTLFTHEKLDWLKDKHIGFLLSIDGSHESQNYNRPAADGKPSFNLIAPYLTRIVNDFPGTTFRSTITPNTAKNMVQDYVFARKTGFRTYYLIPDCTGSNWTEKDIQILFKNYATILEIMYRDIVNNINPLEISQFVKAVQTILPYKLEQTMAPSEPSLYRCGLGTVSLGFSPEGYITGCQEHATYEHESTPFFIGDIENGINKERHLSLLRVVSKHNKILNKNLDCQNCISKKYCASQYCPSHNYLNNNALHIQDDLSCKWQIFQNEQAMILLDMAARDNNGLFLSWLTVRLKDNKYMK